MAAESVAAMLYGQQRSVRAILDDCLLLARRGPHVGPAGAFPRHLRSDVMIEPPQTRFLLYKIPHLLVSLLLLSFCTLRYSCSSGYAQIFKWKVLSRILLLFYTFPEKSIPGIFKILILIRCNQNQYVRI